MASKGKGGAQHSSLIAMNQCLLCFSWKLKLQPRWVKNIYVCLDMRAILKNFKVNKKNCMYLSIVHCCLVFQRFSNISPCFLCLADPLGLPEAALQKLIISPNECSSC